MSDHSDIVLRLTCCCTLSTLCMTLYRRINEIGTQSIQLKNWLRDEVTKFKATYPHKTECAPGIWCDIPICAELLSLPHMVQSEFFRSTIDKFTDEVSDLPASLSFEIIASVSQLATSSGAASKSVSLSKHWIASRVGKVLRIHRQNARTGDGDGYISRCIDIVHDDCNIKVCYLSEVRYNQCRLFSKYQNLSCNCRR